MTKPLVVLSGSRSGTNYFLSVFKEMVPEAVVLREVFRPDGDSIPDLVELTGAPEAEITALRQEDPVAFWEMIKASASHRPLALKIFYYHAGSGSRIWKRFAEDARIVHLIRRRLLDTFVSRKLAQETGRWMMPSDASRTGRPPTLLRLDPVEVAKFIDERKAYVRSFRQRFQGADFHEIAYEDIADHPRLCADAIARLTGVPLPSSPIELPIRKQNTWGVSEIVENYDEVAVFEKHHL